MKIYIAGPMRGCVMLNFPEFYRIESIWNDAGWWTINPAQMDKDHGHDPTVDKEMEKNGLDFDECMARDLPAVASCDAICLMKGWQKSVGANTELAHAIKTGKKVYCAHSMMEVDWQPVI